MPGNRRVPAMLLLLSFGGVCGFIQNPRIAQDLANSAIAIRMMLFALASVTWHDCVLGTLFLALPQVPLTLGNAVIAIREENNRLFPDRPITEKTLLRRPAS